MSLLIGQKAPDFIAKADNDTDIRLSDFKGKKIVLYFYPKDDTPGCTVEAKDFKDNINQFTSLNTIILGVSRDSIKSHCKFIEKYQLPFRLISDVESNICNLYEVLKEKSMFGKKYMGIQRTTFLIDEEGNIEKIWLNVKVKNHIQDILSFIGNL